MTVAGGDPLSVYVTNGDRYEVHQFSISGALQRILRRTVDPIAFTDDEYERWKKTAQALNPHGDWRRWERVMGGLSRRYHPAIRNFSCGFGGLPLDQRSMEPPTPERANGASSTRRGAGSVLIELPSAQASSGSERTSSSVVRSTSIRDCRPWSATGWTGGRGRRRSRRGRLAAKMSRCRATSLNAATPSQVLPADPWRTPASPTGSRCGSATRSTGWPRWTRILPFDAVFLDADKERYCDYLEQAARLVRHKGLLVAYVDAPGWASPAQDRVGGSLVRYCRMSGLLMQPSGAAGPYGHS